MISLETKRELFAGITEDEVEEVLHDIEQNYILSQMDEGSITAIQLANRLNVMYRMRRVFIALMKEVGERDIAQA